MRTRSTLTQLIVQALATSKTGLVNAEIAKYVIKRRPETGLATIDSLLTQASKKGLINKRPTNGTAGKSKFIYSKVSKPSVASIIAQALQGKTRIDSLEVLQIVRSIRPEVKKNVVDTALSQLAKADKIIKSKTLMTDDNVISSQSKFVYTGKAANAAR
jgi:Fe2+ or Zn2+ uptake regulation protein